MSTEVGQGHIDIEPRIDDTNFVRQSRALTQTAEKQWGMYAKNASRSMRDVDQQFQTHVNKQISSWQALDRQRRNAERDRTAAVNRNMAEISKQVSATRRLHQTDINEGAKAAASYERSQMAAFDRVVADHRKSLKTMSDDRERVHRKITVDTDVHSRRWGSIIAHNMTNGFEAAISILPGRIEGIFTRTGPVIGTALMAGITQAIIFAAPALGAMLAGLIFAGVGFAGIGAAAIVGVLDDNRVKEAGSRFANEFKQKILYAVDTQVIGERLANAIDIGTNRLGAWADEINSIIVRASDFFDDIAIGLAEAFSEIIGPLDRFFNSQFMQDIISITLQGFIQLADVFGEWMDKFISTPEAVEGAKLGLQDFFDVLTAGLSTALDLLTKFSTKWAEMNTDPDGLGPKKSEVDTWKDFIGEIKTVIGLLDKLGSTPGMMGLIGGSASMQNQAEGGRGGFAGAHEKEREAVKNIGPKFQENPVGFSAAALSGPGLQIATEKAKGLWKTFMTDLKDEWGVAGRNWDAFTQGVSERWNGMLTGIKNAWNTTWGAVKNAVVTAWNATWAWIAQKAIAAWTAIREFFATNWFIQFFFNMYLIIQEISSRIWMTIIGTWINIQIWLSGIWSAIFTNVWGWLQSVWDAVTNWFYQVWVSIQTAWDAIWGTISSKTAEIWNSIVSWLSSVWNSITSWFAQIWATISGWWDSIFNTTSEKTSSIWSTITGWLDSIKTKFVEIWGAIGDFMSTAWVNIQNKVADGINGVIDIINKGIDKINELLDKIGVDHKLPTIDHVGYAGGGASQPPAGGVATSAKATGGHIAGPGTGTSDTAGVFRLSNGEFVVRAKSASSLGRQNLDYMNRTGKFPGMAQGGRVGPDNEGLLQNHANHLHVAMQQGAEFIIALAAKSGIPFNVGSTFRPGATTESGGVSWHASNKAVDFMGFNQDALAQYFMKIPGVLELIHRTGITDYTIFGGKAGVGGGVSSFLMDLLSKGVDHFLNPIIDGVKGKLPNTPFGWIAGAGMGKISEGVKAMIDKFTSSLGSFASNPIGGAVQGLSGLASKALGLVGAPGSWLGPLLTLIDRESGGNPNAQNNSDSNAAMGDPSRGLMQTIGSTFNAYRMPGLSSNIFDPLSNIVAGLRYIQSKYGSIFNVQQAVGATPHGYDNGGWMNPGWGTHYNGTSKPEAVLTNSQWSAIQEGGLSGGATNITVLIDGVEVAHRAIVEESNNQISRGFRGGRR